jgi:hypothetical protein
MPPKDDAERFRRIRDQQIATRDPMIKVRKLDHTVAQKQRRHRQSFSIARMWLDIPKMWRGTLLGGVVGVLILAILPLWVAGTWAVCGGLGALSFLVMLGFSLGRYMDSRDEIQDLMRR